MIFSDTSVCTGEETAIQTVFEASKLANYLSKMYGMPAPSTESQHPEAWPASTLNLTESADLVVKVSTNIHFDLLYFSNQAFSNV